jgi:hypothetical protein
VERGDDVSKKMRRLMREETKTHERSQKTSFSSLPGFEKAKPPLVAACFG